MKSFKFLLPAFSIFILFLFLPSEVRSQEIDGYPELAVSTQKPMFFFDFILLPGDSDSTVAFSSVFTFSYPYLPFKKSGDDTFVSTLSLNMEVFNSTEKKVSGDDVNIEGLEPAARAFWADTAVADNYRQTKSEEEFLSGHLDVVLEPGYYNYVIQMNRMDGTENRISRVQGLKITPYAQIKTGDVLFGQKAADDLLKLSNLGTHVPFGRDFYALAHIPLYKEGARYIAEVHSLDKREKATGAVFSQELAKDHISTGIIPAFEDEEREGNFIRLKRSERGFAYALLKIPGSTFPNNRYRLTIQERESGQIVSQAVFQTLWVDMPLSLYSLEVAVDMLRFIVDDKKMEQISEGSRVEREQKFRAFWQQRDPTPKTAFNELMAEYYRRIDYAYSHFSSRSQPGYETDQGKVYITYGKPRDVERKFPPEGATTEIWYYPGKRFVFQATSGFGEFKLVSH